MQTNRKIIQLLGDNIRTKTEHVEAGPDGSWTLDRLMYSTRTNVHCTMYIAHKSWTSVYSRDKLGFYAETFGGLRV